MGKSMYIGMPVIRRLPRYYRVLLTLKERGISRVSSGELSKRLGLTASQIRQDLNCFGGFGHQGYGYSVDQLYEEIGRILGAHRSVNAVLLGVGNMGKAIVNHMDFEHRGFKIVGLFDENPALQGMILRGQAVLPLSELESLCSEKKPKMAILCIPQEEAPAMVEKLISYGVKGFWNFSHYDILPNHQDVVVENVHLGDSLMTLAYQMNNPEE